MLKNISFTSWKFYFKFMKTIYFILFSLLVLMTGCAVNNSTGLLILLNTSDKDIHNLKIGNTYLGFLGQGESYEYWYYSPIEGDVSTNDIDFFLAETAPDTFSNTSHYKLKLDYSYEIKIYCIEVTGDYYYLELKRGTKSEENQTASDYYDYQSP